MDAKCSSFLKELIDQLRERREENVLLHNERGLATALVTIDERKQIEQRTKDACFEAGWELVEGIFSAYFFYKERDDMKEQFKQAIYSAEVGKHES